MINRTHIPMPLIESASPALSTAILSPPNAPALPSHPRENGSSGIGGNVGHILSKSHASKYESTAQCVRQCPLTMPKLPESTGNYRKLPALAIFPDSTGRYETPQSQPETMPELPESTGNYRKLPALAIFPDSTGRYEAPQSQPVDHAKTTRKYRKLPALAIFPSPLYTKQKGETMARNQSPTTLSFAKPRPRTRRHQLPRLPNARPR